MNGAVTTNQTIDRRLLADHPPYTTTAQDPANGPPRPPTLIGRLNELDDLLCRIRQILGLVTVDNTDACKREGCPVLSLGIEDLCERVGVQINLALPIADELIRTRERLGL